MNLSLYEQETIINYKEEEATANVYTHNRALRRKLDKLAQECVVARVSHEGRAADYTIPKGWVRIYPPRTAAPLTEEQKQRRREQLASIRKG